MSLKLFYTDYATDEHVASDNAEPTDLEKIKQSMKQRLNEPDNFVGLVDSNSVILQFMVEDDGEITVDVPIHERKGSFMKSANLATCLEIVSALGAQINVDQIDGLEFKTWGR